MSTNILSLDRAIQNTILWLNDIQDELQWEDREMVYKATKAVLQTIRDRLPFEELIHFSANLPLVMKGMLMDNYNPPQDKSEKIKTLEEFYDSIQDYYDSQRRDVISAKEASTGVIKTLFKKIGSGEMRKLADNMPLKLKPLFQGQSNVTETVSSSAEVEIPKG